MQESEIIFHSLATGATEHIFLFNQCLSFALHRSRAEDVRAAVCETLFQAVLNLHYLGNSPVEQRELSAISEVPRYYDEQRAGGRGCDLCGCHYEWILKCTDSVSFLFPKGCKTLRCL